MTKLKAVFRNFANAPKKSCVGGEVKWHNIYTKFCEKVWTCSKRDMRNTHAQTAWWTREPTFSFLSMSLGWKVVRVGCRRRWHINIECNHSLSRDGSVDIVTRLRAGRSGVWLLDVGKRYLFRPIYSDRLRGPPILLLNEYQSFFSWGGEAAWARSWKPISI
jgi:hypothetical protein